MLEIDKVISRLKGKTVSELLRQYSQDSLKAKASKSVRDVQPRDESAYSDALSGARKLINPN